MMTTDTLPNLTETNITDLWRYRQEHADAEGFAGRHRKGADQEILRRAIEAQAEILPTDVGDIFIVYSSTYHYDTSAVDGVLFPLVQEAHLEAEWNRFVQHQYKIDRRWLNRLLKRGPEWREAVDRISIGTKGEPRVGNGPSLQDLGGVSGELEEVPLP